MKLFLLFVVGVFILGLFGPKKRNEMFLILLAITLFTAFGYFFLNQI